jgi:hypothetical protein
MELFDEKNRGRKSRDRVPLTQCLLRTVHLGTAYEICIYKVKIDFTKTETFQLR